MKNYSENIHRPVPGIAATRSLQCCPGADARRGSRRYQSKSPRRTK
ncbi:hypothetical protein PCLA_04r0324 [Pseudomonas citronellolis]|nr:hypothetical protein PCLA_04r0324 [Pseudomonas citronellolis]